MNPQQLLILLGFVAVFQIVLVSAANSYCNAGGTGRSCSGSNIACSNSVCPCSNYVGSGTGAGTTPARATSALELSPVRGLPLFSNMNSITKVSFKRGNSRWSNHLTDFNKGNAGLYDCSAAANGCESTTPCCTSSSGTAPCLVGTNAASATCDARLALKPLVRFMDCGSLRVATHPLPRQFWVHSV